MPTSQQFRSRPTLAVAMIVRDAADLLAASLDSIRGIADQIVVADLGSADHTVEVARDGGATVHEIAWQDCFATARNECLRRVRADWVLWLEAGETLYDTVAQQLRNFVDDAADNNKAYLLFVQRPAAHPAACREQVGELRLVPHRPELKFSYRVREQIAPSVQSAAMGVDMLDCVIHRSDTDRLPLRLRTKARRQLNLVNLALSEEGEQPGLLLARAEALAQLGRTQDAAQAYRHVLKVAAQGSPEMLEAYYGLLTAMDADPTAADAQLSTCVEAMALYPLDAQLLCGMGSYLLRQQRLDLAARSYEMAVTHGKVDPTIWHLADLPDVAVTCWSLALQLLGDAQQAESVLRQALVERPDSLRPRRQLIEVYVKTGREREALAQCKLLPEEAPYRDVLPEVIRGAALAVQKKHAPAIVQLSGAYNAGCRDSLCLRWLATAYLAVGDLAEVDRITSEWQRQEPHNLEVATFRQALTQRREDGSNGPISGKQVHQQSVEPATGIKQSPSRRPASPKFDPSPFTGPFASQPTSPTS